MQEYIKCVGTYFWRKNVISFRELRDQGNFVETGVSRNVTEKSLVQLNYVTVCGGADAPLLKSIEVVHLL